MKPGVMIGVRCHEERHGWWHPMLGLWLVSLAHEQRYTMSLGSVMGAPNAAAAANHAARDFLAADPSFEWLCIVDNDVAPPLNMMRILDEADETIDAIGPISHMCHITIRVQQGHDGWDAPFRELPANAQGHQEVDRIGGGCWFVRRRVFAKMERPYFVEKFHPETHMLVVSDDVYFQHRARELGCKLVCDTRFICSHFHTLNLAQFAPSHPKDTAYG